MLLFPLSEVFDIFLIFSPLLLPLFLHNLFKEFDSLLLLLKDFDSAERCPLVNCPSSSLLLFEDVEANNLSVHVP